MLILERLAWSAGVVAVGFWLVAAADRRISSAQEIARFAALRAEGKLPGDPPDQKLWSPLRVKEWEEARTRETPLPVAVLSIKRIGLEVPVLQGTDDWTLNRAVGVIEGTPLPGSPGNSGIAGHRDSFFRVLKDVVTGDLMTVETARATETYRIERIWIVRPGGCVGARPDGVAVDHARDVLSVLFRGVGAAAVHRARRSPSEPVDAGPERKPQSRQVWYGSCGLTVYCPIRVQ